MENTSVNNKSQNNKIKKPNEKTLDKPIVTIGKEDFQTAFFQKEMKFCTKHKS